jgi:predicted house-cleaning noncanonical NTP pyrophosphatase (MazG superfamily)
MSYQKLVRDNIPNIIKSKGETPITRILSDKEYKVELEKKLLEECNEVINSTGSARLEEFADLLEVMMALGKIQENTLDDIINASNQKREQRGAFDKKIFLEGVQK